MTLNLAIYGYDTDIGKLVIEFLDKSSVDLGNVYPLSPLDGEFDAIKIHDKNYLISSINDFDFDSVDILLLLCPKDEVARLENFLKICSCVVIDTSGYFENSEINSLINAKLNPYVLKDAISNRKIISIANSLSSQIALTLSPLHDNFGISKANITALLSVSEMGILGTEGLAHEAISLFNGQSTDNSPFETQMAFNLVNKVGKLSETGTTTFEDRVLTELGILLEDMQNKINLYCIQVPVFYGHMVIVNLELEEPVSLDDVKDCFNESSYIKLCDDLNEYITPVTHLQEEDNILISRLKCDGASTKNVNFMALMDNVRAGQALSCVEIIELMEKR